MSDFERFLESNQSILWPGIFGSFLGPYVRLNSSRWGILIQKLGSHGFRGPEVYDALARLACRAYSEESRNWGPEVLTCIKKSSPREAYMRANEGIGREAGRIAKPGWRVLDIGTGSGETTLSFLRHSPGPVEMHCLEPVPAFLKKAVKRIDSANGVKVNPINSRLEELDTKKYGSYFDMVISSATLHHIPRLKEDGFSQIYRILKPGRYAVIGDTNHSLFFPELLWKYILPTLRWIIWRMRVQAPILLKRLMGRDIRMYLFEGHCPRELYLKWLGEAGFQVLKSESLPKTSGLINRYVLKKPQV